MKIEDLKGFSETELKVILRKFTLPNDLKNELKDDYSSKNDKFDWSDFCKKYTKVMGFKIDSHLFKNVVENKEKLMDGKIDKVEIRNNRLTIYTELSQDILYLLLNN